MNSDNLPYSKLVNIPALLGIFRSTAASYKYIYFLSLLNVLKESGFDRLKISLDEILLEMLSVAWFPHNYLAQELDRLNFRGLGNKGSNVKKIKRSNCFMEVGSGAETVTMSFFR